MKKPVYNLKFPSGCSSITIFSYRFIKIDGYPEQLQKLQHLISYHADINISANTGQHAHTAFVEIPDTEQKTVFKWKDACSTALDDILLLLSLFTRRDVFAMEKGQENNVILADPRVYDWGGILRVSIPYRKINQQETVEDIYPCDIGFEEGLNQIYSLIRSEEWQNKYRGGHFLFLAKQAFHKQTLEASFTQCWTIWEHLFALLNDRWMSDDQIEKLNSVEKIAFLLTEYAIVGEIDDRSRERIRRLAKIRNRIVHNGRFPEKTVYDDAILFIRLTEFIIAKTLGLSPSNLFNTMERLEEFLRKNSKS